MEIKAQLRVVDPFGVQKTIQLSKPEFTIGRRLENDLQIMSNSISRYHGAIICENGNYYLVDKGSKTGVFINDQRVDRAALSHLDRIRLGGADDYDIRFIVAAEMIGQSSPSAEQRSISGASRLAASAQEELKNLARYVEVNQAFKFSLAPDDVLRLIVDAAIELAAAQRGLIMLKNREGKLAFKIARDNRRNDVAKRDFALSTSIVKQVLHKKQTVVLDVGDHPSDTAQSVMYLGLRTAICVPLTRFQMHDNVGATAMGQHELIGVLYLDSRRATGALSQSSHRLLRRRCLLLWLRALSRRNSTLATRRLKF